MGKAATVFLNNFLFAFSLAILKRFLTNFELALTVHLINSLVFLYFDLHLGQNIIECVEPRD